MRIGISGYGLVCNDTNSPEYFWNSICGHSEIKINNLSQETPFQKFDLTTDAAVVAARAALRQANINCNGTNENLAVIVSSALGGMHRLDSAYDMLNTYGSDFVSPFTIPGLMPNGPASAIAIDAKATGPCMAVLSACSSGNSAVINGCRVLRMKEAQIVIAGGVDAARVSPIIAGFKNMGASSKKNICRPFDINRDGFVSGSGAGVLIIEPLDNILLRGGNVLAEIVGYGETNDAFSMVSPDRNGVGLAKSIKLAVKDILYREDNILINAHGTGTKLNDSTEIMVYKKIFHPETKITAIKGVTGHGFAASGIWEVISAVISFNRNEAPPIVGLVEPEFNANFILKNEISWYGEYILSTSLGFGGHNSSILLKRFNC